MLARFNALPADRAEAELLACCAAPRWARAVAARRPYPDAAALLAAGAAELAALDWAQLSLALADHPRIGERAAGDRPQALWSRREQAGMAGAPQPIAAELAEVNGAYERRFGHVFLIFASGRTPAEMLAAARARLGNDVATERGVVRGELSRIVALRLGRLVS